MSTGPGRLQRRVVEVVEAAEGRTMTRRQLEDMLVPEGYDRSNILRALRGLHDRRLVHVREGHTLDEIRLSVPEPVRVFTDDEIAQILERM
jgi:uncharacterized protein Smg (DUF494 family)